MNIFYCPNPKLSETEYQEQILTHLGPDAKVSTGEDGYEQQVYSITMFVNKPNEDKINRLEELGLIDLSYRPDFGHKTKQQIAQREAEKSGVPLRKPMFINAGDYLDLQKNDVIPYVKLGELGKGGSALVEQVRDTNTGRVYARKTIGVIRSRDLPIAKQRLLEEVKVMRRLAAHHHIIKVHATYILDKRLALILTPVANGGDLSQFLFRYRNNTQSHQDHAYHTSILNRAFGCLASGLAFMHKQTIRHKDIKPQNILVNRGRVLYTDFGLSRDFADAANSVTTGTVQGYTARYAAPEVAAQGTRSSKSDMFSLGCVFIEMYAALQPDEVSDDLFDGPFHENLGLLVSGKGFVVDAAHVVPERDVGLVTVVRRMVEGKPLERPSAAQVTDEWFTDDELRERYFCVKCRDPTTAASLEDNQPPAFYDSDAGTLTTYPGSQSDSNHNTSSTDMSEQSRKESNLASTKDT